MAPSFGAIALTVLMAYPLNIFPCRYTIDVILQRSFGSWGAERGSSSPPERSAVPMPAR